MQILKLIISDIKEDHKENEHDESIETIKDIEVSLICKLLSSLKSKQNLQKLSIIFKILPESKNEGKYLKFINYMRQIAENNKNLQSITVTFPIINLYHYSIEMLKLLEINQNIRKFNSFHLDCLKQGDDIILNEDFDFIQKNLDLYDSFSYEPYNYGNDSFDSSNDFGNYIPNFDFFRRSSDPFADIMPIIISEIFKKYHPYQIEDLFFGSGSDKTTLTINSGRFDLTQTKREFALNCLSVLNSLKKLYLRNISFNSQTVNIVSENLKSLNSLTTLKLFKLKIKLEQLILITSPPNLNSLTLEKITLAISSVSNFKELYQKKKILKLVLINVEYLTKVENYDLINEFYHFRNPYTLKLSLSVNPYFCSPSSFNEVDFWNNLEKITINNTDQIDDNIFEELVIWCSDWNYKLRYIRFYEYWWDVKKIIDEDDRTLAIGDCEFHENDLRFLSIVCRYGLNTIDLSGNKKIFNHGGETVCSLITIAYPDSIIFTNSGYHDLNNDEKISIQEVCGGNIEIILR